MPSIYELTEQYRMLEDAIYNDEIEDDELDAMLQRVADEIDVKIDGYCAIIADIKRDADALKAEADRLTSRKRALERRIDHLKAAVGSALDAQGKSKIKTGKWSVSFRMSAKVEITDLSKVPPEYLKPITEDSVRKADIKRELIDTGEVLPWCRLVEGRSLIIR